MKLKQTFKNFPRWRKSWICVVAILCCVAMSNAQSISGTVSADGLPLPGANILIKGTTKGVSTDFDGKFTITASPQTVLVFSYIGYTSKEVTVGNKTQIDVVLSSENKLDEVVVIGYGTQKKSDLTGAVSTISAKSIASTPNSRVDQVLQGRATGVQITQNSGEPGAPTSIRIRGGNSITGSNEPLWVIDGIIVGTNFNLNNINSNDIKSIEILKDASSIAIYGSRGANGVVLVTTKNGSGVGGGKPQINIGFYSGMQLVPEKPSYLSQPDQIKYTNEDAAFRNAALPFPNDPSTYPDNDWVDLLLDAAPINNVDVSLAGASENGSVNYFNSLNYFGQEGLINNSGIEKFIFRSNLNLKLSDKLKAGFRFNFSRIKQKNSMVNYGSLLAILPTQPVYNPDGSYNGFNEVVGTPFANPLARTELDTDETYSNNLLGTVYLEYNPSPKWRINVTFNPEIDNTKTNQFFSSQRPDFLQVGQNGSAAIRTTSSYNWNNENTVQYQTDLGEKHSITALGGASFQKNTTEGVFASAFGISTDATGFNNIGLGTDPVRNVVGSSFVGFQIASFFARLNYSYDEKYLLTLVGRADGSSVFPEGNKYNFFPSVAGAWKISKESFMQNQNVVKDLKLRASYGYSGNQAIEPYRSLAVLEEASTTYNGVQNPGVTLGRPENPNLEWETTSQFDIALEASFFKGTLSTEVNYYHKKTEDLLLDVTIPRQTGFTSQLQNVGSLENKGWEVLVNSRNFNKKDFKWNTTLTLSSNKNKVTDLGGPKFIDVVVDQILGSGNTRIFVGEPVPVFTGANYLGTWKSQEEITASGQTGQQVGGPRFEDRNGDKIISNEDFVVLGSAQPNLIYGLDNTFSYKDFDFSFFFQGTAGNEIYNLRTLNGVFARGEEPKYSETIDRWTPTNTSSNIPRAGNTAFIPSNSDFVEDGSFLRLKNVRLAYNFPIDKMKLGALKSLSVYATGTNLLLFSDFKLIDPETSRFGRTGLGNIAQGFSSGEYPNAKVFTFGLNATF